MPKPPRPTPPPTPPKPATQGTGGLHFEVDHAELVRALKIAAGTCSRRPTLPVLGGVKIEAAAPGRPVTITTTDLEVTSTTRLLTSVDFGTGAAIVPLRELAATLKGRQPKGTLVRLEVDQEAGLLRVHAGGLHAALNVHALEDYPTLRGEAAAGEVRVTSDLALISTWARRVLPAVHHDEARPVLTAVQVKRDQGELTATATDSYRLHTYRTLEAGDDSAFCFLLPARALELVAQAIKLHKASDGSAWWHGTGTETHGTGEVRLQVGPSMFWARAVEGEFPNWQQLIPATAPDTPTIDVHDGAAAAALIKATFPWSERERVPIILEASGATIAASCKRQDVGKVEAELPGLKLAGYAPIDTTAFNPFYLRELLAALDYGTLQVRDSLKPALAADGNGFRGIIMPVRLP